MSDLKKAENFNYGLEKIFPEADDFLPLLGTDYVELYVGNAKQAAHFYKTALGFQSLAYSWMEDHLSAEQREQAAETQATAAAPNHRTRPALTPVNDENIQLRRAKATPPLAPAIPTCNPEIASRCAVPVAVSLSRVSTDIPARVPMMRASRSRAVSLSPRCRLTVSAIRLRI